MTWVHLLYRQHIPCSVPVPNFVLLALAKRALLPPWSRIRVETDVPLGRYRLSGISHKLWLSCCLELHTDIVMV